MTNWFASTSLKKTSWPLSGHLIQRFSGESRRLRKLRIFGRTTLEIQFIEKLSTPSASWPGIAVRRTASPCSPMSRPSTPSVHIIAQGVDARHKAGHDELILWRFLLGPANTAGQLRDKLGHSLDGARRRLALFVETVLHG